MSAIARLKLGGPDNFDIALTVLERFRFLR